MQGVSELLTKQEDESDQDTTQQETKGSQREVLVYICHKEMVKGIVLKSCIRMAAIMKSLIWR